MLQGSIKHRLSAVERVFVTEWFSLDALTYESLDNRPYYRLSCNDSVVVLALTLERKIILVRQFRPAIGAYTLELPAGDVKKEELPEMAVRRELAEETGYACGSVRQTGTFKVSPDRLNSTAHVFFGEGAKATNGKSRDEGIEVVLVTEDEFKEMVFCGDFRSVSGLAIYFLLKHKGFF